MVINIYTSDVFMEHKNNVHLWLVNWEHFQMIAMKIFYKHTISHIYTVRDLSSLVWIFLKNRKKFSRTNMKAFSAGYYSVTYKLSVFSWKPSLREEKLLYDINLHIHELRISKLRFMLSKLKCGEPDLLEVNNAFINRVRKYFPE